MNRLLTLSLAILISALSASAQPPNIIFIMADDAGIGDYACYHKTEVLTPAADRLAAEGMRFTNAYSGSAVCGPTRCVVMTGLHPGHCLRRANQSKHGLLATAPDTPTVASILKKAGYATGGFGKWGLGNPGTTGVPEKQGFDLWYGYYDQVHAHDYYPEFLIRNSKQEQIPGNQGGKQESYTVDLIEAESLKFIDDHKDGPFFLYAAWTPPHGKYVIPAADSAYQHYKDKPWSQVDKNYAAMVTKLDNGVTKILAKLKEHGIDDNTIVFYTSDNGANAQFIKQLSSTGGLRGNKRLLYEGGIRAPFLARWPGKIAPGSTSDLFTTHMDLMATSAALANTKPAANTDGISIVPTLLGKDQNITHKHLYFEIYEPRFQQSVRLGDWKGYRLGTKAPMELYNLADDPAEAKNLSGTHPDVVKQLSAIMNAEHTPSPHYDAPEQPKPRKGRRKKS